MSERSGQPPTSMVVVATPSAWKRRVTGFAVDLFVLGQESLMPEQDAALDTISQNANAPWAPRPVASAAASTPPPTTSKRLLRQRRQSRERPWFCSSGLASLSEMRLFFALVHHGRSYSLAVAFGNDNRCLRCEEKKYSKKSEGLLFLRLRRIAVGGIGPKKRKSLSFFFIPFLFPPLSIFNALLRALLPRQARARPRGPLRPHELAGQKGARVRGHCDRRRGTRRAAARVRDQAARNDVWRGPLWVWAFSAFFDSFWHHMLMTRFIVMSAKMKKTKKKGRDRKKENINFSIWTA